MSRKGPVIYGANGIAYQAQPDVIEQSLTIRVTIRMNQKDEHGAPLPPKPEFEFVPGLTTSPGDAIAMCAEAIKHCLGVMRNMEIQRAREIQTFASVAGIRPTGYKHGD